MPERRIQKDIASRLSTVIESARSVKENFNNAAVTFLLTEMDAAICFCRICRADVASFSDSCKIENNLGHVEHALVTALRAKNQVRLKAGERKQFRGKAQQLEALVMTLLSEGVHGSRINRIERCLTSLRG